MEKRSMDLAEALLLARAGHAGRVATALLAKMDHRAEEITELGNKLVAAHRRLADLEKVNQRAKDARTGGYDGETADHERGWLDAANYIHGASK